MLVDGICDEVSDCIVLNQITRGIPLVIDWSRKCSIVQKKAVSENGALSLSLSLVPSPSPDYVLVATRGCSVQWCPPLVVMAIEVGPPSHQQLHHLIVIVNTALQGDSCRGQKVTNTLKLSPEQEGQASFIPGIPGRHGGRGVGFN